MGALDVQDFVRTNFIHTINHSFKKIFGIAVVLLAGATAVLSALIYYTEGRSILNEQGLTVTERTLKESEIIRSADFSTIPIEVLQKRKDEVLAGTFKDWKTYENEKVGISFQYPDIFERENMRVSTGGAWYQFVGVLDFYQNHWISLGGVTPNYSAPRGGSLEDTQGYMEKDGVYFARFVWGDIPIVPSEFWDINNGKDKAVVVRNTELETLLSGNTVAVFVNIPNSIFPGIVFSITPPTADGKVDERDVEIMHRIVSSIVFL